MEGWRDELRPSGWKVYTLWDPPGSPGQGWFLDDERYGIPFLERVRALGPHIVCAHKGIAGPIPSAAPAAASPRDIGPAAAAVPRHPVRRLPLGLRPRPDRRGGRRTTTIPTGASAGSSRSLAGAGIGPGAQRVGRARLDLVPDAAPPARGRPRARQAAARGRPRAHPVGHRLGLVRPAAVADRRVPRASPSPSRCRSSSAIPRSRPTIKAAILGGNATRLYGIDAAARRRPTRPGWPRPAPSWPAGWRRAPIRQAAASARSDPDLRRGKVPGRRHRGRHGVDDELTDQDEHVGHGGRATSDRDDAGDHEHHDRADARRQDPGLPRRPPATTDEPDRDGDQRGQPMTPSIVAFAREGELQADARSRPPSVAMSRRVADLGTLGPQARHDRLTVLTVRPSGRPASAIEVSPRRASRCTPW